MRRAIVCVLFSIALAAAAEGGKQFRQGEFDSYSKVDKALNSNQFQEAVNALDAWKQKYPDSEYKDEREALYAQAYAGLNEPAKALDAAIPLLGRDVSSVFPGPAGQPVILRLLYSVSWAIPRIPNPSSEELSAAEKAAHQLLGWDQPLPGVPSEKWAAARADMKDKASAALLYLAMLPGKQAMERQPPDCAAAEAAYTKALASYPDKSIVSYELARALTCETKDKPDKGAPAIYEFERAAVVDPTLGGVRKDPGQVQTYADNVYVKFHGSDEGLAGLKQSAKQSPLPPTGFTIKSAADLADEKRAAFDAANPQLALWLKIKTALSQANGSEYFENGLKGTAVPQLQGRLLESRPACRPRELVIGVPLPDSADALEPEITLKLTRPLTGKPETGQDVRWQGVPSTFNQHPFMLTMDAEPGEIEGLRVAPCGAAPTGGAKTR
jgi:hypothetical protein